MEMYKPKTRSSQLLVEELVDELLIYDVERNEVHCLNGSAVQVWALCDGERTVSEIARALNSDLEPEAAETLVWTALDQFVEKHLLEEVEDQPLDVYRPEGMTRRQMLLRLSLTVAMLPLVESIVSPEAALARSESTPPTPITPI
jgi:hypothetical protein